MSDMFGNHIVGFPEAAHLDLLISCVFPIVLNKTSVKQVV